MACYRENLELSLVKSRNWSGACGSEHPPTGSGVDTIPTVCRNTNKLISAHLVKENENQDET